MNTTPRYLWSVWVPLILLCACACGCAATAKEKHCCSGMCGGRNGKKPNKSCQCTVITGRRSWGARPPRRTAESLANPVPVTVIHHSGRSACNSSCSENVRDIQNLHMDGNGWDDIGYNFLIGGDGEVFEGRGWRKVGAHAGHLYNEKSIGICLIGTFTDFLPTGAQLTAAKNLIECGVSNKYIASNYVLYGHRDVRDTDCPGSALYQEISTWSHKGIPA